MSAEHEFSFDPTDPFPLLPQGFITYRQAQLHSESVDRWLGIQTQTIENAIQARYSKQSDGWTRQFWIGLPVQALLTPYTEIREILERLSPKPGEKIIDLGAGYGRVGFVLFRHFP